MQQLRGWDPFHWLTFLSVGGVAVVLMLLFAAVVADLALGLGWGYGWTEFWGLLGMMTLAVPLGLVVMAVQGLFDRGEE